MPMLARATNNGEGQRVGVGAGAGITNAIPGKVMEMTAPVQVVRDNKGQGLVDGLHTKRVGNRFDRFDYISECQ